MEYRHVSVMKQQVLALLEPAPGKIIVDGTFGGGGHAQDILNRILPGGQLIGTDLDEDSVTNALACFSNFSENFRIFHDNYSNLPAILAQCKVEGVHGILLDLGVSLHLLEKSGRGFSFMRDEPLDMRMDKRGRGPTAMDVVNTYSRQDLSGIFFRYGEERRARKMAHRIVEARKRAPISTSLELARIVAPEGPRKGKRIHPATLVFQALRIYVNDELGHLETFLQEFLDCLLPGGRLCVIAFHSLEDRMVKRRFQELAKGCTCPPDFPQCTCHKVPLGTILSRKVVKALPQEIEENPMSRSAKLRAFEKMPAPALESGGKHG